MIVPSWLGKRRHSRGRLESSSAEAHRLPGRHAKSSSRQHRDTAVRVRLRRLKAGNGAHSRPACVPGGCCRGRAGRPCRGLLLFTALETLLAANLRAALPRRAGGEGRGSRAGGLLLAEERRREEGESGPAGAPRHTVRKKLQ